MIQVLGVGLHNLCVPSKLQLYNIFLNLEPISPRNSLGCLLEFPREFLTISSNFKRLSQAHRYFFKTKSALLLLFLKDIFCHQYQTLSP